jgi:hypothetical protein
MAFRQALRAPSGTDIPTAGGMLSAGAIPRQNLQEREEIANGSVPIRYHPTTPDFSCMRTQPRHVAGAFSWATPSHARCTDKLPIPTNNCEVGRPRTIGAEGQRVFPKMSLKRVLRIRGRHPFRAEFCSVSGTEISREFADSHRTEVRLTRNNSSMSAPR